MVRVDGEIRPLDAPPLAGAEIEALVTGLLDEAQRSAYASELEIDVAIVHASGTRFRLNAFNNRAGAAAAFRTIPADVPSLDQLEAPWVLKRIAGLGKGLVLVTGPTGSGKSTTLAALIDRINDHREPPHPDHRGPDRVRASLEALADQPARGRARHADRSPARCAARSAPIRTSSWSASCATTKPSRSR